MNIDRNSIQRAWLEQMAMGLTIDQHEKAKQYLNELTDEGFSRLMIDARGQHYGDISTKGYIDAMRKAQKANDININNSAMNSVFVEFLQELDNIVLLDKISRSSPSDIIKLTKCGDSKIMSLWTSRMNPHTSGLGVEIPSDLFFAKTIPLLDCRIIVDETNEKNGMSVQYRVVVFSDYKEIIDSACDDEFCMVGAVITEFDACSSFVYPISVVRGVDGLLLTKVGYINMDIGLRSYLSQNMPMLLAAQTAGSFLETWYGIQIALLHPIIKDVFKICGRMKNPEYRKASTNERRNIVKYIKQHQVDEMEFDNMMYDGSDIKDSEKKNKIARHTLVWYVIGHWRTFKDGKKTFVQPHWKGALKDIKKNIDDRERKIPQAEVDSND